LTSTALNSAFTYDANGNTLTKTAANGTTSYAWDFENRLTSVTLPKGSVLHYLYDPFGRRIFSDGTGRIFVYDGENGTAFAQVYTEVASFDIASGAVNWTWTGNSTYAQIIAATAGVESTAAVLPVETEQEQPADKTFPILQ